MDFISNLREFKNLSLPKVLSVSTSIMVIAHIIRKWNPNDYQSLMSTIHFYSIKTNYEKWESIFPIAQRLVDYSVIYIGISVILVIIVFLISKNVEFRRRHEKTLSVLYRTMAIMSVIKINISGYYSFFMIESHSIQAATLMAAIAIGYLILYGLAIFFLGTTQENE